MTLIAQTLNGGAPVLIGDLLITSKRELKSVPMPSNHNPDDGFYLNFIKDKLFIPVGLYQKLYLIKKNLCIGLAGDVQQMKNILKEIKLRFSYFDESQIDEARLAEFMKDIEPDKNFDKCAFIILLLKSQTDGSLKLSRIAYPKKLWDSAKSEIFTEVCAFGTGKEDFLKLVKKKDSDVNKTNTKKGTNEYAFFSNLGLISEILVLEKFTLTNLSKAWGGGFETIICNGNTFIKFPEITYIIFSSVREENNQFGLPKPVQVLHYKYLEKYLLIYSIDMFSGNVNIENGVYKAMSNDFEAKGFVIPEIEDFDDSISLPNDLSFVSNRLAIGFGFITKDKNNVGSVITAHSFLDGFPNQNIQFDFNGQISFSLSAEMINMVTAYAVT